MPLPILPTIAARCESIGRNCEFGLLQRALGVEQIGLLRWAGASLAAVTRGIETRFAGLGQDLEMSLHPDGEWRALDRSTGLMFHTHLNGDRSEDDVREQEARRLPWLAEKLIQDIEAGEKLLVYSSAELRDPRQAEPLVGAIRSIGSTVVVLVCEGEGQTVYLGHNAFAVFMPRLTELNQADHLDLLAWIRVLVEIGAELG